MSCLRGVCNRRSHGFGVVSVAVAKSEAMTEAMIVVIRMVISMFVGGWSDEVAVVSSIALVGLFGI